MTKDGVAGARLSTSLDRQQAPVASGKPSAHLLPVRMQRGTVAYKRPFARRRADCFSVSSRVHPARPSTIMTDDNRTRPPSAGRKSRLRRRATNHARWCRRARRNRYAARARRHERAVAARRRYFAPSASTSTPSPVGSARTGARIRPATSRAASLPAKSACRGWSSCSTASASDHAGSFPAIRSTPSPTQMQDGGRCRPRDRHARLLATRTRSP